jgi:PKHD-type hydroxylase
MNLSNYYWYFQSAIPPRICDMIVHYGKTEKKREVTAITGGLGRDRNLHNTPLTKKELKDLKKKRDSNIVWMNDRWIYKEIQPYIGQANHSANWKFSWDWSESCQFTKYKKGQYYDWHCDSWDKPYSQEGPTKGKIRKLSVTVTLSDPKTYKGGELEFDFRQNDPDKPRKPRICKEILPKGSIVVFPSFIWHRVKPVTKGVRYSLVIWNLGYPFQ